MSVTTRQVARDEQGAFIVLWVILVTALLAMVAIVVDLGQVRSDRRSNQALADYAALAAGIKLSGRNMPVPVRDPQAACQDALASVKRNGTNVPPTTSLPCGSLPSTCTDPSVSPPSPGTAPVRIQSTGSGDYRIEIEYPVAASRIADNRFTGSVGVDDGSPCSRMRVSVLRRSPSFFGGITGSGGWTPTASAVVRGEVDQKTLQVAALLLLERNGCGSLQSSGQGAVIVQSPAASNPGRITADSRGANPPCSNNNNPGGKVVWGTSLPGGGGPSIVAQSSSDGTSGVISVYAANSSQNPTRAGAVYPGGLNVPPTPGDITSRIVADNKYNNATNPSGAAVTSLNSTGLAKVALTAATAPAAGYTVRPSALDPSFSNCSPSGVTLAQDLFIDCPNFQPGSGVVFTGSNFVFNGKITVANNRSLSMPNAQTIFVEGCTSSCGGNNFGIDVAGTLQINHGLAASCALRAGPGAGGVTTNWTRLAVMTGAFNIAGSVRMCQTVVYLAGGVAPNRSTTINSGQNVNCSAELPCPVSSGAGNGAILMKSGGSEADWSAPNQLTTEPTAANPFEDLALWTETADDTSIKATGANRTEGVYFLPNSLMTFTGQASQLQPLNAQFISRALDMKGQGDLALRPNPADAIKIPTPGLIALIR